MEGKGGRHPTLVELQWKPLPKRRSSKRLQLPRFIMGAATAAGDVNKALPQLLITAF
jgi:hypothetical protein